MYVHWLDEIEDYRLDVTHLQGSRNPTDQLSRRGFTDGKCQAPSTGDAEEESQQELFLLLGRDAPVPARLAAVHAPWAANRQAAAATFADTVQGGGALPSVSPRGGAHSSESPPMSYVPRTGAELPLGTGTTMAPSKLFWSHPTCTLGLTPTICKYCVIFKFGSRGRTPRQVLPWQPTARRRSPLPPGRQSCSAHSIL
jgi:hypothetical protein